MWYGYVSEHHLNVELKTIYVVTKPCQTREEAIEELGNSERNMLYNSSNAIRRLFHIRFYGNQHGAIKLPDAENLIKPGCLGVKILLTD